MTVQGNRGVALVVRAALRSRIAAHSDMTNLQRGIAIGPILFVVALLAVLATAIAAGSGAFSGDTSAVKAKAQAAAILEYANEVKMPAAVHPGGEIVGFFRCLTVKTWVPKWCRFPVLRRVVWV